MPCHEMIACWALGFQLSGAGFNGAYLEHSIGELSDHMGWSPLG